MCMHVSELQRGLKKVLCSRVCVYIDNLTMKVLSQTPWDTIPKGLTVGMHRGTQIILN